MEKSTREQMTEIFLDYVAERFDREASVNPDDLIELAGGVMSVRNVFTLIRLGKL